MARSCEPLVRENDLAVVTVNGPRWILGNKRNDCVQSNFERLTTLGLSPIRLRHFDRFGRHTTLVKAGDAPSFDDSPCKGIGSSLLINIMLHQAFQVLRRMQVTRSALRPGKAFCPFEYVTAKIFN